MNFTLSTERDLALLHEAIDLVLEEADERNIELSITELTHRLFEAYQRGERDPFELASAVLFGSDPQIH